MCSEFLSQLRKGDCFMRGPHYAGDTRSACLQGRRDDETTVFSQSVSNSESAPSLGHVSGAPLLPVAHALTRSFMKEQSSSHANEKLEWLTHIEAVLEILNEAIVVTNQDQRILFVNSPFLEPGIHAWGKRPICGGGNVQRRSHQCRTPGFGDKQVADPARKTSRFIARLSKSATACTY